MESSTVKFGFDGMGAAVVFGGSGGLGAEICRRFASAKSDVAFSYRSGKEKADSLCGEIEGLNVAALSGVVDLEDPQSVQSFIEDAVARFGGIHTIVFATGPIVRMIPIAELELSQYTYSLNADAVGFFNVAKAGIPFLRKTRGSIVALSTSATKRYPALDLMSAGPKAAVEMIAKGVAREEGRNGIRSNCVLVGQIAAGQGLTMQEEPRGKMMAERALQAAPLRRHGTAEDIADAVLFLASSAASFITGETLCVDGGIHL